MSEPTIEVKNLTKIYRVYDNDRDRVRESLSLSHRKYGRDHYALNDISFTLKEGELLGVIGVNGSGKSTLLKIITGVLKPTSGSVKVNGKISSLLELGAGFNPDYTGVENIYFNGMVMGFNRKEMDQRIDDIIAFADIGEFIHQPVRTYSSGMYVRLAYSVAVCIEPDILIVDEALAVGDSFFQMKSMTRMQELFKKGKNVIFVSHDTGSVKALCTKALYLEHGQAIAYGPARDVVEMYESKVRQAMSEAQADVHHPDKTERRLVADLANTTKGVQAHKDSEYEKRVAYSREGSGEARVRCAELLSTDGKVLHTTHFNQEVILRLHIEFLKACNICVGYHIRDAKNIPLLGSNSVYEQNYEVSGESGEWIVADFNMNLPMQDGRYNVMTVLSQVVTLGQSSSFIDITKDGLCFDMEMNTPRIWNKLQLPNRLCISKATPEEEKA